jgi:hypothetical protein
MSDSVLDRMKKHRSSGGGRPITLAYLGNSPDEPLHPEIPEEFLLPGKSGRNGLCTITS